MRPSKRVRDQHWPDVSSRQHVTTPGGSRIKVTIGKLSNEVLLIIFLHYLNVSPQFWPTLVHVCKNWRQIVFKSPLTLHLRLYCKHGTPVLKNLRYWPVLPIVVQYGGSPALDPPSPEDEDNVIAALEQSDRVSSISLTITHLVLLGDHAFRRLQSTGIYLPSLPQLLSPSVNLVDLQLHEIPGVGYFSPEAFASALQSFSLHFISPASRPSRIDLSPSPPGERIILPALTYLKFRGASEYLNSLVTRIDAPSLVEIEVRFFNQLVFHLSQLFRFIDRIEMQWLHRRADINFSERVVSITFTQPDSHTRLALQISCEHLDWQLSSIAQICDNFSPFLSNALFNTTQQSMAQIYGPSPSLSGVQDLGVGTTQQSTAQIHDLPSPFLPSVQDLGIGTTRRPSAMDDVDGEQWLGLIRAFDWRRSLSYILGALCPVDGEHTTVLPALRNLRILRLVSIHGPLREAVELFAASRRLSCHPVQVYPYSRVLGGDKETPGIPQRRFHCDICDIGFIQQQACHRHNKDTHTPQYMCAFARTPQKQTPSSSTSGLTTDALILDPFYLI
ncbi:hypothetical protein EDB87DRAFT_1587371 [Lactarius vividus]|nr:hypothetical protein EDB87DRAFT_1587371 [Lactarius vividus]